MQELLRKMCGMDLDVVFAPRKEPLTPPHYKLITRDQLKQVYGGDSVYKCTLASLVYSVAVGQ